VVEIPQGDDWREVPCWVRAEAAGGECKRPSVVRVYGMPFCEEHGAECNAGALEELYSEASFALDQMEDGYPEGP
jgi:hypothetical protein